MRFTLAATLSVVAVCALAQVPDPQCRTAPSCPPKVGQTLSDYARSLVSLQEDLLERLSAARRPITALGGQEVSALSSAASAKVSAMDSDRDGKVSRSEAFAAFARGGSIATALMARGAAVAETDAFMRLDADGDGFVSKEEVFAGRQAEALALAESRRVASLRDLEARVGSVAPGHVQRVEVAAKMLFAALDSDSNGVMSRSEVQSFSGFRGSTVEDVERYAARIAGDRARKAAADGARAAAAPQGQAPRPPEAVRQLAPSQPRPQSCVPFGGFSC